MMKQMTLATGTGFELHARPTRKAEFLAKMENLTPWAELCALNEGMGNSTPPRGMLPSGLQHVKREFPPETLVAHAEPSPEG